MPVGGELCKMRLSIGDSLCLGLTYCHGGPPSPVSCHILEHRDQPGPKQVDLRGTVSGDLGVYTRLVVSEGER